MRKVPQMNSRQVEKLLVNFGFIFIRQKGSHRIFTKNKKLVVVPFSRKPLKKGTLYAIMKEAGITKNK